MANERKTEALVRAHFAPIEGIVLEEQKSDNAKIARLLQHASKKGTQHGRPDFIITHPSAPQLVIVVECKASVKHHGTEMLGTAGAYAVNDVLLYASFLAKEYDVIAIAVSGETKASLKVSHFLQLQGIASAQPVFGGKLLSLESYKEGYIQTPEKLRQDYDVLMRFTKALNEELHQHKILESQRSLLISSILIALDNRAFLKAYGEITAPAELANYLVDTVANVFSKANLQGDKLQNLRIQYSFIRTDTSLATKPYVLRDLIHSIHQNIHKFIKTHAYHDVLGQLYIEFLRYANSDKGLGIVLTPPHITALCNDLAYINKHSVVYDNCAGTGGFLIAAMRHMVDDAAGDRAMIQHIKEHQLVGVEFQAHIFALACANMYIHQDGKTNIINGNCFDDVITKAVKEYKPTVGLLNPPYKTDKKKDEEELAFVLNNLDALQAGGLCVAILPMRCAVSTRGEVFRLKEILLEKHTLEAVLSMPDELFFNSNVGVVTCVMIFTAHRPHVNRKKTFFGYYKDDGFVKRKTKGRVDALERWQDIKAVWLELYTNRLEKPGMSINKQVSASDEWCAEAYMATNYAQLVEHDFVSSLHRYASFLYENKMIRAASDSALAQGDKQLSTRDWQCFSLTGLFDIRGSRTTSLLELEGFGRGAYPYITTQASNNGAAGFYNHYTEEGGVLTIDSAVTGYCSYQKMPFSASDHVEVCVPKFDMTGDVALFLTTVINKEQYRYSYGRKASQQRLKEASIMLPARGGKPDLVWIRAYIRKLPYAASAMAG